MTSPPKFASSQIFYCILECQVVKVTALTTHKINIVYLLDKMADWKLFLQVIISVSCNYCHDFRNFQALRIFSSHKNDLGKVAFVIFMYKTFIFELILKLSKFSF